MSMTKRILTTLTSPRMEKLFTLFLYFALVHHLPLHLIHLLVFDHFVIHSIMSTV